MKAHSTVAAVALALLILLGLSPSTAQADFVQHPNDSGAVDTIAIQFSQVPDAATGVLTARLDLYGFTAANHLMAMPLGFAWDNPNAVLDSALIAPEFAEAMEIFTMTYMRDDLATSNRYDVFCLVAIGGALPNWPAAPQRRLLSSYFFTLQEWSSGDSLVADTSTFTQGSKWHLVGRQGTSWIPFFAGPAVAYDAAACCAGYKGNIDCSPDDLVTMSDFNVLVDHLFATLAPLCCPAEADLDSDGGVGMGDLSILIDHLFISFNALPACP
jgi:hypothetical protein